MSGGADWSQPTTATNYLTTLTNLEDRDVDALTMMKTTPSNAPVGGIRWDRVNLKFQEYNGTSFVDMVMSVAGGGTGSSTPAGARAVLGLGTMAVQNSNAVAITGGTITGVNMDASTITSGVIALARGGTSASLALGANGSFLQSNGSSVVFGVNGAALTNLNASNITAGTINPAFLPAGINTIHQVQYTVNSPGAINNSSNNYAYAGLACGIQLSLSTNKVIILGSLRFDNTLNPFTHLFASVNVALYRYDNTNGWVYIAALAQDEMYSCGDPVVGTLYQVNRTHFPFFYVDTPGTTVPYAYGIWFSSPLANQNIVVQTSGTINTMILMESV